MNFFRRNSILLIVFFTGAEILIIEILALRILAPYFGNTIFTSTSVIGVILAALSFGYYLGGSLADKHPKENIFYSIIVAGGLTTHMLQILSIVLLPTISTTFSIISGPVISSLILFLAPTFLLGMLSPFAIKLHKARLPKDAIGKTSGEVFFASTLGSILGTFLAGFYLIPTFQISRVLLATGVALFIVGYLSWIKLKVSKMMLIRILVLEVFMITAVVSLLKIPSDPGLVYSADGVYEWIGIVDQSVNDRPARFFYQNRSAASAIYLDDGSLVFDYAKYLPIYKLFDVDLKNVLVIGGGTYTIPKALIEADEDLIVDSTEIEPSLIEIAYEYFMVPESARMNVFIEDGRRMLTESDKKYDLIFADAYFSFNSIPSHLTTVEFFELVKSRMSKNGVFMANVIGSFSDQAGQFTFSEMKTWLKVFPNSYFFAVESPTQKELQNNIFLAVNGDKRIDFESKEFRESEDEFLKMLGDHYVDINRFDLSKYKILTDDYAPVDYLAAKMLRESLKND